MNQQDKKDIKENKDQFFYINRWVDKKFFRAFVYGKDDSKVLANSFDEYEKLISSDEWFAEKKNVPLLQEVKSEEIKVVKIRKSKDGNTNG